MALSREAPVNHGIPPRRILCWENWRRWHLRGITVYCTRVKPNARLALFSLSIFFSTLLNCIVLFFYVFFLLSYHCRVSHISQKVDIFTSRIFSIRGSTIEKLAVRCIVGSNASTIIRTVISRLQKWMKINEKALF